ncbi:hypothetical protein RMB13_00240 [Acinetobacter sp. V102_4]|uniref:hypothetical protein n=1 Tax=Acinetobacter sp. V102_4 TaxID=3072984 RepID=UPI00287F243B|nr:hypothetical protein [Acinetobacter sp. V102_4]MDS7927930.1 hypothetical protein [Acinetobacter sp. V102_4]
MTDQWSVKLDDLAKKWQHSVVLPVLHQIKHKLMPEYESARRQELGIKKAIWLHSHAGENQDPHTLLHMEKPLMWLRACICMASGLNLGN